MLTKTPEKILQFPCNLGFFFAIRVRKPVQFIFHGGFATCKRAGDADGGKEEEWNVPERAEIDIFLCNEFRVVSLEDYECIFQPMLLYSAFFGCCPAKIMIMAESCYGCVPQCSIDFGSSLAQAISQDCLWLAAGGRELSRWERGAPIYDVTTEGEGVKLTPHLADKNYRVV